MSKGKVVLGTLFAAAAGLVTGILTAPKSGKETRDGLKLKADVLKTDATVKAEEVQTKANTVVDEAKSKVTETTSDIKGKVDDLKGRTERAINAARDSFTSSNDKISKK